ncbi:MAG: nucleotide sugar dehydrogenase [Acidobacteria bacterium]|nr:nucleotide sugar dehydrogenase [Acidobacteriota bacterium]
MTPSARDTARSLHDRITGREAKVGIIGLGYVGVPLALTFVEAGYSVLGFDVDPAKIEQLNSGGSYIGHVDATRVRAARDAGALEATTDTSRLDEADAILICVPTPLDAAQEPEMSYVRQSAEAIAATLRPGQLVVLESTTYPGTCQELLRPILETSRLHLGEDFFLAYSPEREDPGNPDFGTRTIPKVVGGVDTVSGDLAQALYEQAVVEVVRVSNAATAEATKLLENIFRAVNIALVNELKLVFESMDIDIWEVLDAASTKPFGFMRFNPGPGWGGHCIPIDPFYLTWKAKQHGITPRFIELAGKVNVEMPRHVVQRVRQALGEETNLAGRRILILGLAYKPDVADPRESPAFEIFSLLAADGADVDYHDPYFPTAPRMRSWSDLPEKTSIELNASTLASYDALVLVTDHSDVDYNLILQHARLIVDTRGTLPVEHKNVVRA